MKIQVTREDIKDGQRGNYRSCPIAIAASRAFDCPVTVGLVSFGTEAWHCLLPQEAKDFVRKYDNRIAVEPFEFEIELFSREQDPVLPEETI